MSINSLLNDSNIIEIEELIQKLKKVNSKVIRQKAVDDIHCKLTYDIENINHYDDINVCYKDSDGNEQIIKFYRLNLPHMFHTKCLKYINSLLFMLVYNFADKTATKKQTNLALNCCL